MAICAQQQDQCRPHHGAQPPLMEIVKLLADNVLGIFQTALDTAGCAKAPPGDQNSASYKLHVRNALAPCSSHAMKVPVQACTHAGCPDRCVCQHKTLLSASPARRCALCLKSDLLSLRGDTGGTGNAGMLHCQAGCSWTSRARPDLHLWPAWWRHHGCCAAQGDQIPSLPSHMCIFCICSCH